jgi:hypothetical protein
MSARFNLARIARLGALSLVLAASTAAVAGSTIKVTNNSKEPWCLRITDDSASPLMAQGSKDQAPVELNAKMHKLVYYIQPGESCTLQFKDMKDLPLKAEVGLVDKAGTEKGQLTVETKRGLLGQAVDKMLGRNRQDETIIAQVKTKTDLPNVVKADQEDAVSINADFWSCPFD